MEQILLAYYDDHAKNLHMIVYKIFLKFGGLAEKDRDDFYSLANEVFVDVMKRYDSSQTFETFLYSCLLNKIKTEMTRRNREKRKADRMSISIDTLIGDDENTTIGDMIADTVTIEKILFEKNEDSYSNRMLLYLNRLSDLQKEVLRLNMAGFLPNEIREELYINEKEYVECYAAIHSYRNISLLIQ